MSSSSNRSRATIVDVAKKAGVSTATVSRVINQTTYVAPETQAQVQAAVAELNYRPQYAAQVLARQETNTIGLLLTEISGDFLSSMLRGIEAEARENGFSLLIYATRKDDADRDAMRQPLGDHNTDGVLVFVDSLSEVEMVHLNQIGFPVVLIHRSSPEGLDIPCVTIENKLGTRKLFDHLIEVHDYRRIAFLTGPTEHDDSYWREMGYRESLASHDLPFDPELLAAGEFNRDKARDAVAKLLAKEIAFDAIFAGDDEAAIGVLTALDEAGKRVPEDIAVVGFDDTALSRYLTPPLTTVRAPTEQVGREATRQLIRLIRGDQVDPLTLLPTELVIRRSCGCAG